MDDDRSMNARSAKSAQGTGRDLPAGFEKVRESALAGSDTVMASALAVVVFTADLLRRDGSERSAQLLDELALVLANDILDRTRALLASVGVRVGERR